MISAQIQLQPCCRWVCSTWEITSTFYSRNRLQPYSGKNHQYNFLYFSYLTAVTLQPVLFKYNKHKAQGINLGLWCVYIPFWAAHLMCILVKKERQNVWKPEWNPLQWEDTHSKWDQKKTHMLLKIKLGSYKAYSQNMNMSISITYNS